MYNSLALMRKKIKIRKKIAKQEKQRLTVYKSNRHIYAQLYMSNGSSIILSLSTLDKEFKEKFGNKKLTKTDQAVSLGFLLSKKINEKGIKQVVFDRSGFKFHGRIKAVADSISNCGILC